jgi:taurine transport system substrate-binding protein
MTGPDVLLLSRAFADEDPERAREFLAAYFEALAWVKEHPDEAAELVHREGYLPQDLDQIRESLSRFEWHTLEDQHEVMSDEGLFGQTEYVLRILHEDMRAIPEKPDFRKWVRLDLLPPAPAAGGGSTSAIDD